MVGRRSQINRCGEHSTNAWTLLYEAVLLPWKCRHVSPKRRHHVKIDQRSLKSVRRSASPATQRSLFLHRCINCKGYYVRSQRLNTAICKWWGNGRGLSQHLLSIWQGYPAPLTAKRRGIEPTRCGAKLLYGARVFVTTAHLPASTASIFRASRFIFCRNVNICLTDFTASKYQP